MTRLADNWGPGPWDDEPDELQWTHGPTGYACAAIRHPEWGQWCAYVRLPLDHPLHGAHYGDPVPDVFAQELAGVMAGKIGDRGMLDVFIAAMQDEGQQQVGILFDVHGSITFTNELQHCEGWWFGFDCGHGGDLQPGLRMFMRNAREHMDRGLREQLERLEGIVNDIRKDRDWPADQYRALPYVIEHANRLAGQLASIAHVHALMSAEAQQTMHDVLTMCRASREFVMQGRPIQ